MSELTDFVNMAAKGDFLVLDTETTGLQRGEICQVAIIDPTGAVRLDTLVQPVDGIPQDATRIHGITDDMVAAAPRWNHVAPTIQEIVRGRDLVVYNAVYDRKMFHQSGEARHMDRIEWKTVARWHCAMLAYAEFWGDWNDYHRNYRWQSLTNACRQQKIEVQAAHSALGDCLMTLAVVNKMVQVNDGCFRGNGS
jgi:DNA polymerase-3 subunit epsilon